MTLARRLPAFTWDRIAPLREKAGLHPDGAVDLSIGTPVDPVPGFLGQRRDPVPGEGGKPARERHSSALMPAGSAATTGWSLPVLPVLEAPPGEPRSSKKSTLTL